MNEPQRPAGRRERNKQAKRDRIIAAASALFSERAIEDVTTQEIADRADIGTGTLFLYAKTKGELLLLVQNAHYAKALDEGRAKAANAADPLQATVAILRPIVACNRRQIDNGRAYLKEMAFGRDDDPSRGAALDIVAQTEDAIAAELNRAANIDPQDAATIAHVATAITFLSMAGANSSATVDEIAADIHEQLTAVLRHRL